LGTRWLRIGDMWVEIPEGFDLEFTAYNGKLNFWEKILIAMNKNLKNHISKKTKGSAMIQGVEKAQNHWFCLMLP